MSSNLQNYFVILERLAKTTSRKERSDIMKVFCRDKNFIKALKEICSNTVRGNLTLSLKDKNRLKKHKRVIESLASSKPFKRKLVQSGSGFLAVLLPLVASIIGSAFSNGAHPQNDSSS
jgi:hypothetical protein